MAALASEMPRQAPEVRAAAAQRVRGLVALVCDDRCPPSAAPGSAAAVASQMVGALQLARALGDNAEGRRCWPPTAAPCWRSTIVRPR